MNEIKGFKRKQALFFATVALGAIFVSADVLDGAERAFDYESYSTTLRAYVDENGMVNYQALKTNRETLDAFSDAVGDLPPEVYENWTEAEKIAFWINAYNGLTLKAIIDRYPIEPSFVASLRFPKNSIRQIPGVWDKLKFRVMDREMTLDEIEHSQLRRNFDEPRIHVALVCAAMGCPPLRNEPFTADKLSAQLDDQARRFLNDQSRFRIDRFERRVYLSPIFDWFGNDFVRTYGANEKFEGHGTAERAVLNFVGAYLSGPDIEYLSAGKYNIEYLDYDWSLNGQK